MGSGGQTHSIGLKAISNGADMVEVEACVCWTVEKQEQEDKPASAS